MKKKVKEINMLLEMEKILDSKASDNFDWFTNMSVEDKAIICGITKLFEKFCSKLTILNILYIANKLAKILAIIGLFLLVLNIFNLYILVIGLLLFVSITSIIFKIMLYKVHDTYNAINEMLKSMNIEFNDFLALIENVEL